MVKQKLSKGCYSNKKVSNNENKSIDNIYELF